MTRTSGIAMLLAAGLAAVPAMAGSRNDEDRQREREVREKIREFQQQARAAASEAELVRAIERLGEIRHPLVTRELARFLTTGGTDVRIAAAEGLGNQQGDAQAADALLRAVERQTEKAVKQAFLRQVGRIGVPQCARSLAMLFRHPDLDIAEEAVITAGDIRSVDLIQPLIDLLGELELLPDQEGQADSGARTGIPDIPGAGNTARERVERKRRLIGPTRRSLQRLTGQNWETSVEWGRWWREARREFRFPEPQGQSDDGP